MRLIPFAAALLVVVACHVIMFGQTFGEITGEVRDPSGGTVGDVKAAWVK